jgi:hypothetical protein
MGLYVTHVINQIIYIGTTPDRHAEIPVTISMFQNAIPAFFHFARDELRPALHPQRTRSQILATI